MNFQIRDIPLETGEWVHEKTEKTIIFLHHTAGGHRPDWTAAGWNRDRKEDGGRRRVATSYIIGGVSTSKGNADWDGTVVRTFPEDEWAYHIGVRSAGQRLDRPSIGIEICNYGFLTLSNDGRFFNYVDKPVPDSAAIDLGEKFRNYRYYHRYTDAQINAVGQLLTQLSSRFGIDLKAGLQTWLQKETLTMPEGLSVLAQQQWLNEHGFVGKNGKRLAEDGDTGANTNWAIQSVGKSAFEYNTAALSGEPGLWTHTNVRRDKTDCSPQPALLDLIRGL